MKTRDERIADLEEELRLLKERVGTLAEGGTVSSRNRALVGETGPEAVLSTQHIVSTVQQARRRGML